LPRRRPKVTAVAVAQASVCEVTTTSSSGIFSTGEKKCMPRTREGRRASRAISPIGSEEVLLANTHSSGVSASVSASTLRFSSTSSKTASITRSAWRKPVGSVVTERRSSRFATPRRSRLPRRRRSSNPSYACFTARPSASGAASLRRTTAPASAAEAAMPAPMSPAPTTASLSIAVAEVPSG
jgi:hypothetical protein